MGPKEWDFTETWKRADLLSILAFGVLDLCAKGWLMDHDMAETTCMSISNGPLHSVAISVLGPFR